MDVRRPVVDASGNTSEIEPGLRLVRMMAKILKPLFVLVALLLIVSPSLAAEPQVPQPRGMLNDFAGKLGSGTSQQLETLLENFRDRTGIEVSVVTVRFDDMQGYPIEDYALTLGRQWGVGRDSQKRALVLLVAIKEPDGQGAYHGGTRLEVSRRLEGDLPDSIAGDLIRKMKGDFQAGRFDSALSTGTQTILATLAQRTRSSIEGVDATQAVRQPVRQAPGSRRGRSNFPCLALLILFFVVLALVKAFSGRGRGGGRRDGGIGSDLLLWALLFGRRRGGGWNTSWGGDRDSSWGGGGWGGGGDDGGGFGGFGGGGDFGGGGASDSW